MSFSTKERKRGKVVCRSRKTDRPPGKCSPRQTFALQNSECIFYKRTETWYSQVTADDVFPSRRSTYSLPVSGLRPFLKVLFANRLPCIFYKSANFGIHRPSHLRLLAWNTTQPRAIRDLDARRRDIHLLTCGKFLPFHSRLYTLDLVRSTFSPLWAASFAYLRRSMDVWPSTELYYLEEPYYRCNKWDVLKPHWLSP